MKNRQAMKFAPALCLFLAAALALTIFPGYASAQDDTDGDGISDDVEQSTSVINGFGTISPCLDPDPNGPDRNECWHYQTPDLFVAVQAASPSELPADLYKFVNESLGVATHEVDPSELGPNRYVLDEFGEPVAPAILTIENINPSVVFGIANIGVPTDGATVTLYSLEMRDWIQEQCLGSSSCADISGVTGDALGDLLIQSVAAHEHGHRFRLLSNAIKKVVGNHWQAGTNLILEQFLSVTKKGRTNPTVTFYISQEYSQQAKETFLLK